MRPRSALIAAWLLLSALVARAEDEPEPERHAGWELPSPKMQEEMDPLLIPVNKGAIFVPAMTSPAAEPYYLVFDQAGQLIAERPTGMKTIVPPGEYTIRIGSGVVGQMLEAPVRVVEGRSAIVDPGWAGLVVRVVDERNTPFRGSYELIRLPDNQDFGIGLGADFERGETLRTWLLPPGRYMIVKTGENYRARTNFLTVRLLPGELVHFTLVQHTGEDEPARAGEFLGGGAVDRGEADTKLRNWKLGLLVGGNFEFDRADHVPGREFGNTLNLGLYLDGTVRYNREGHVLYGRLEFEHGRQKTPTGDFDPRTDEVDFDAVYIYRIVPWFGPYIRAGYEGQIFPSYVDFGGDREYVRYFDGPHSPIGPARLKLKTEITDFFGRNELDEGAGFSFDISPSYMLTLDLRVGFGALQVLTHGLFREVGCSDVLSPRSESEDDFCAAPGAGDVNYFLEVENSYRFGPEASLVGFGRFTRWISVTTEFKFLQPIPESAELEWQDPIFKWQMTVGLRLVSFASVNYIIDLTLDRELEEELQVRQRILLRLSYEIL